MCVGDQEVFGLSGVMLPNSRHRFLLVADGVDLPNEVDQLSHPTVRQPASLRARGGTSGETLCERYSSLGLVPVAVVGIEERSSLTTLELPTVGRSHVGIAVIPVCAETRTVGGDT